MKTIQEILEQAKTVAVVGLSPRPERDSHEVGSYLKEQGYRIIPVNPQALEVLGEKCYPNLSAIPGPIDVVDIFRRSETVGPVVAEAIAVGAKAVWMQEGVINQEAARRARAASLGVVMDRCMKKEHQRLKAEGRLH